MVGREDNLDPFRLVLFCNEHSASQDRIIRSCPQGLYCRLSQLTRQTQKTLTQNLLTVHGHDEMKASFFVSGNCDERANACSGREPTVSTSHDRAETAAAGVAQDMQSGFFTSHLACR